MEGTGVSRHRARLAEIRPRIRVLEFGGAAGTLATLGDEGLAVQEVLARELSLALPEALWAPMSAVIAFQERLHETRSSKVKR